MVRARLVTGYVPIKDHPRTAEEYGELGERLSGVPVRKQAFYDRLEKTWLHQVVSAFEFPVTPSQGDNPQKNTIAYHCVNHQKFEWLAQAAEGCDDDWICWIDYGIFSQPGICNQVIFEAIARLEQFELDVIIAPGCIDKAPVESAVPCWRFCGSFFAVPRSRARTLATVVKSTAIKHILNTKNVEWEINTLARVEQSRLLPMLWYKADHNETQFTNLLKEDVACSLTCNLTTSS